MADSERWIVIPRWDEFQHYKNRDPSWVKNYTRLLRDWNYVGLTFRLRGILHGIWLLYAASGLELGASPAQLGRMLGDDSVRMRDLQSLSDAGFIQLSASRPLASRYHAASPEKETEIETETEEQQHEGSTLSLDHPLTKQTEANNGSPKNGARPPVNIDGLEPLAAIIPNVGLGVAAGEER